MKNLKNALFIGLLLSQGNLFSCSSGLLAIRQLNMVVRSGQVLDLVQKKNKELTTLYNNLKHKDTCHQAKMVIHQKIALAEKEWTCVNKKLMKNPEFRECRDMLRFFYKLPITVVSKQTKQ